MSNTRLVIELVEAIDGWRLDFVHGFDLIKKFNPTTKIEALRMIRRAIDQEIYIEEKNFQVIRPD